VVELTAKFSIFRFKALSGSVTALVTSWFCLLGLHGDRTIGGIVSWGSACQDIFIASCSRTPSCDRWAIGSPGRFRWQGGWDIKGRTVFEKCCKGFLACLVECSSGFLSCAFPTVIASVGSGACAARSYSATSSLSNDGSIC